MTILLVRQFLSLTSSQRNFAPLPVALAPMTERLTLRLNRPTTADPLAWGVADRIGVQLIVDVDGVEYRCTGQATGGIRVGPLGLEVPEYRLSYTLPWGFFGARTGPTKRLGETSQSVYRARVELERLVGSVETVIQVEGTEAPAPRVPFRSSVAFDAATDASEAAGDGILSLAHTAAGSDRAVFGAAGNSHSPGARTSTSLEYAGNAMTEGWDVQFTAGAWSSGGQAGYSIAGAANVPTGAQTVTSTLSGAPDQDHILSVMSLTGVDSGTPVGTPPTPTTGTTEAAMTVTVGSVGADDMVVDSITAYNLAAGAAAGSGQTQRNAEGPTTSSLTHRTSTQPGTEGGVMSWTNDFSDTVFILGAIAFKPVAAAGTTQASQALIGSPAGWWPA